MPTCRAAGRVEARIWGAQQTAAFAPRCQRELFPAVRNSTDAPAVDAALEKSSRQRAYAWSILLRSNSILSRWYWGSPWPSRIATTWLIADCWCARGSVQLPMACCMRVRASARSMEGGGVIPWMDEAAATQLSYMRSISRRPSAVTWSAVPAARSTVWARAVPASHCAPAVWICAQSACTARDMGASGSAAPAHPPSDRQAAARAEHAWTKPKFAGFFSGWSSARTLPANPRTSQAHSLERQNGRLAARNLRASRFRPTADIGSERRPVRVQPAVNHSRDVGQSLGTSTSGLRRIVGIIAGFTPPPPIGTMSAIA